MPIVLVIFNFRINFFMIPIHGPIFQMLPIYQYFTTSRCIQLLLASEISGHIQQLQLSQLSQFIDYFICKLALFRSK